MELLSGNGKIILVVTHDPLLALMTQRRIVMKRGGIEKIIETSLEETGLCKHLNKIDNQLFFIRELVRTGEEVTFSVMEPA